VEITSIQTVKNINKIYIDSKLHLLFKNDNINGVQSWIENDNKYLIEISVKEGIDIIAEYNNREIWEKILEHIDNFY
jgi:hypothetical protein